MQTINIETNQQDDYQVRESYRNLRTNIFLSGKDTKVVMFTSCGPNEPCFINSRWRQESVIH